MENQNENQKLVQMVEAFPGGAKQLEQSASYDPADDWMNIIHDECEISLSRENFEKLMELGRRAYSGITENSYTHLKNLKLKESAPLLEAMTDDQIQDLMREDAKHVQFKHWDVIGFTKLLLQEVFKRNKIGYKSIHQLSTKQRGFIENLGIYEKQFYGKP